MGNVLARATRRTTLRHVQHVAAVAPATAAGLVARVYQQVERDFGMLAPPISLHSPAPGPLAASWLMLRESLLATALVSRQAKEAVATAVSLANSCPYCVEVHSATLGGLVGGSDAPALATDRVDAIIDPDLHDVAAWARASQRWDVIGGNPPPFTVDEAPELIGVAVTFHYLNRMVNIFLQPSLLPTEVPPRARTLIAPLASRLMGRLARPSRRAGDSLDLLPPALLPPDLAWAHGRNTIAAAFGRASAAIDAGAKRSVPAGVRAMVLTQLAEWTGEAPNLSLHAWLDGAVSALPPEERPAGRLALLAAVAAYRVTGAHLDDFRRCARSATTSPGNGDKALIELTSWASLAAARRVGAALHQDLMVTVNRRRLAVLGIADTDTNSEV